MEIEAYQKILNGAKIGLWRIQFLEDGKRLEGDEVFWHTVGAEPSEDSEADYRFWLAGVDSSCKQMLKDAFRQMLHTSEEISVQYLYQQPGEDCRVFRLTGRLDEIAMGGEMLFSGYQQEITAMVVSRTEREKIKSEQEFWERLLKNASFAILECELSNTLLVGYVNAKAKPLLAKTDWLEDALKTGKTEVVVEGTPYRIDASLIREDEDGKSYQCALIPLPVAEKKDENRNKEELVNLLSANQSLLEQNKRLLERYEAALGVIGSCLSENEPKEDTEIRKEFDAATWSEIKQACAEMEYDLAEEKLKDLTAYSYPKKQTELLYRLLQCCADFNYENLESLMQNYK